MLSDFNFQQEQKWDQIRNQIKNIKAKLSPQILAMTVGELQDLFKDGVKTYEKAQEVMNRNNGPLTNITNTTLSMSAKYSRQDDGKVFLLFFFSCKCNWCWMLFKPLFSFLLIGGFLIFIW